MAVHKDTETLLEERKRSLAPNLSLSYSTPLAITRGLGPYLYTDSERYLDCVNNVCHVGHCHPTVVAAAASQLPLLNTNTRYLHPAITRLAAALTATMPAPLSVCFFVCTGSEANELALRLATTHTGRAGVAVLQHAYHGNTDALVGLSSYKFDRRGGKGKPPHVLMFDCPDGYRGIFRNEDGDCGSKYIARATKQLSEFESAGGPALAAFFAEPLLGCAGQIEPPEGYLSGMFDLIRSRGGVCVADEVQVGFGRVGTHFWGFETQGAVPDIVTLGKPFGNGFPLAAVVTTPAIAASFNNGMEYFNTFGGNPVAMEVGCAVMDVIRAEGLQHNALRVGAYLKERLRGLQDRFLCIGDVRGRGLFLGVELVTDRSTREPAGHLARHVVDEAKDKHNILLSRDGPNDNVLKIKPPICFSRENADALADALAAILENAETSPRTGEAGTEKRHKTALDIPKPAFTEAEAKEHARVLFGLDIIHISPLDSYEDQNFKIRVRQSSGAFVLKFSRGDARGINECDFQNCLMSFCYERGVACPMWVRTHAGAAFAVITHEGHSFCCRLVRFIPGDILSAFALTGAHLASAGEFLAQMDLVMQAFRHPCAHRPHMEWDLANFDDVIQRYVGAVAWPPGRLDTLQHFVRMHRTHVVPFLPLLRTSIVHNDANDCNIIATDAGVAGIIDFGDAVHTHTVNNLAIMCAYLCLKSDNPLEVIATVLRSYAAVFPLRPAEACVLYPLVCARLCMSAVMSAVALQREPDNEYLAVTAKPAWDNALPKLRSLDVCAAVDRLVGVVATVEAERAGAVLAVLEARRGTFAPVLECANWPVGGPPASVVRVFDFSATSAEFPPSPSLSAAEVHAKICGTLVQQDAPPLIGVGKYLEPRALYTTDNYATAHLRRDIHLGVDLFVGASAGVRVRAPLRGRVCVCRVVPDRLDYGGLVMLEHVVAGVSFYTLYGHLSHATVAKRCLGEMIEQGGEVGVLGCETENGGWAPHLHFQCMTHLLGYADNFPGVGERAFLPFWSSVCVDPNLLLALPGGVQ